MTGQNVYDVLNARGVTHLHHANSVATSRSFLKMNGLASRGLIEASGLFQTNQITDDKDKKFNIWNDVFVDTVDIHARAGDRNKYGPVLFVMRKEFLLALPSDSSVWVTRMNPSRWIDGQADAERYILTAQQLALELSPGDFGQMLVIKTTAGKVPFNGFLDRIILDDPVTVLPEVSAPYQQAAAQLAQDAVTYGVAVQLSRRTCSPVCKCVQAYAEKSTRIPYFFKG